MRRNAWISALGLTLALWGLPSRAQICNDDSLTAAECEKKVSDKFGPKKTANVAAPVKAAEMEEIPPEAAASFAGDRQLEGRAALLAKLFPEISALPGAGAAFDDFLSRLKIGVTTEGLDDEQALAFELTDFLGLSTEDGYKVRAVARGAKLFDGLSELLSDDDRKKREKSLGDFDDVEVSFSYTPVNDHFGINLASYQALTDELYGAVLDRAKTMNSEMDTETRKANDVFAQVGTEVKRAHPDAFDTGTGEFKGSFNLITEKTLRDRYRNAVEQAATIGEKRQSLIVKTLGDSKFFRVADLVANQPQIVASATRTVRNELVGPEMSTFKFSYEAGFVNVNSLRRSVAGCKGELLDCYTAYLTPERLANAARNQRLTASIDWSRVEDFHLLVDGAQVDADRVDRLTGSLTFGRNLRYDEAGKVLAHVDLEASYEDWSDDADHQNRAFAKLTFSQKVSDDISATVGVVWASKPEFRGEVDKDISARVGLTYRFVDKNGKKL